MLQSACWTTIYVVLAAPAQTGPAMAQDETDSASLDEIIVTARRREESLQDVPISVAAFSDAEITRSMMDGIEDYLARTPGVSFMSTGARDRKDITIRGISNFLTTDSSSRVGTFGFYIDEFNVSAGTSNPQVMDIDRIEVLRGPQGTYFGRNAVGGAINITTKKPDLQDFQAESTVEVARFSTYGIDGIVNLPLVEDVFAIRANLRYQESDGNIENIHPIGGGNGSENRYGRISLRYAPTDRLLFDLSGSYTRQRVDMREGVPSGVFADFSRGLYSGIVGPGVTPHPDGVGFYPENTDRVNFNRLQELGADFYILNGRISYDFDRFSFRSITGFIDSEQLLSGDIDGSSFDYFYESNPVKRDSFSQEMRLQSTGEWGVDWTVGAIVAEENGSTNSQTFAGSAMPFGLPEGFNVSAGFVIEDNDSGSKALFGEAVWHLTERMDITGGLRYTYEDVSIDAQTNQGQTAAQEASFDDFSPKVSISYRFSEDLMSYATISKGFKSGGLQIGTQFGSDSFDSETLWNYEVGLKSNLLDNRVRLNATAFYMDWSDVQAQFNEGVLIDGELVFFAGIQNAASARSYGFEADVSALIGDRLALNAGFGYVNAKFIEFQNAFVENATHDLSGRSLPSAPKWSLNADAEYGFPVARDFDGYVRLEWFYRDDSEPDLPSLVNEGFPWDVPSFHHVNLRIGIERERFSVTAFVENLLDEKYYTNAYEKVFLGGVFLEPSKQVYGVRFNISTY
jgi:iron complex outermembrane receptor protein